MEPIKAHVCRSCRLRLTASQFVRSFSTSNTLRIVPPESPYYVDVPTSHQAFSPYHPQPKGTLPTPREIFPANRPDKSTPEYISKVTPDPQRKNVKPRNLLSEAGRHKVRMAETRKTQLREGLAGLQARKQTDLQTMSARSSAKQRERAKLLAQAEREDARLTNVSVPKAMRPQNHHLISIEELEAEVAAAKQMHAAKVENYKNHVQAKYDEKMDALHTLYMNARNFVTTEAQMSRLLKDQFDNKKRFETDVDSGDSIWNFGAPDGIKEMIADATNQPRSGSQGNASMLRSLTALQQFAHNQVRKDSAGNKMSKDQERLKKIAEKLSGGKI